MNQDEQEKHEIPEGWREITTEEIIEYGDYYDYNSLKPELGCEWVPYKAIIGQFFSGFRFSIRRVDTNAPPVSNMADLPKDMITVQKRVEEYLKQFNEVYVDLANHYQVTLIPMFLEGIGGHQEYMQNDNLHPKESAQPLIINNIWPTLKNLL